MYVRGMRKSIIFLTTRYTTPINNAIMHVSPIVPEWLPINISVRLATLSPVFFNEVKGVALVAASTPLTSVG